ncbi:MULTISPECIES: YlxR family protein [Microbacterium]|uniref:Nucleic-acid-binding protein n=1 Tax=Microbacterium aurum TaxID=36805 RepID=A0A1P8U9X4_9MICO|nr:MULTISPECIES: YlxR family protein [Microbacterium]APZ34900.1 nucleic-acid-binding protein [Microbacterium aurum]MBD3757931.1 YlxR family protein [Microbacterium sp.]MBZ6370958.1 YlxR family protein [Microbacterium hominis]MCG7414741.1 YlxR family protein [Microbacterium aurum]
MEPVRTCVGCRARAPRSSLLRVVEQGGALVADEKAVLPGRGAWVHDTSACVDAAIRRRAFGRALRVSGPLDTQTFQNTHQRNG